MSKKIFFLVMLILILAPGVVFAANYGPKETGLEATGQAAGLSSELMGTTPEAFVGNIIKVVLSLIGVIFLGLMLYGGFRWMTAHGEPKLVEHAKDTIQAAAIGIIIVSAAYAITYFVIKSLT